MPVGSKNLSRLSHTLGGSRTESLTSLCPLFPYPHVLGFLLLFLVPHFPNNARYPAGAVWDRRPSGYCAVEESTGGTWGSPGLVKLVSHMPDTEKCEAVLHKSRIARGRLGFAGIPDRLLAAAISRRMHRISPEPPSEAAESKPAGERLLDMYPAPA